MHCADLIRGDFALIRRKKTHLHTLSFCYWDICGFWFFPVGLLSFSRHVTRHWKSGQWYSIRQLCLHIFLCFKSWPMLLLFYCPAWKFLPYLPAISVEIGVTTFILVDFLCSKAQGDRKQSQVNGALTFRWRSAVHCTMEDRKLLRKGVVESGSTTNFPWAHDSIFNSSWAD